MLDCENRQNSKKLCRIDLTHCSVSQLPSRYRRGGRDINEDAAKPPLMERTGWSGPTKHFGMPDHPVCGAKVGCAAFFLMPQPPLLFQEGSCSPAQFLK